jgi:uncharacterized protein YciI
MLFPRILRAGMIVAALAATGWLLAQSQPPSKQYMVLVKRGPKWVEGKPAMQQALGNHGQYLQEQMTKGTLQLAGPFSDDSGGMILYKGRDEADVRAIAEHDPGVMNGTLAVEWIRPFYLAFDAATGKSPFSTSK